MTLPELLERVERAGGPDRELDFMVAVVCDSERRLLFPGDVHYVQCMTADELPNYTSSLDAAIALCERLFPGHAWTLGQNVHHRYWQASLNTLNDAGEPTSIGCSGATRTPALALLAAILRARIAEEKRG